MIRNTLAICALLLPLLNTACNTVEGFGQDVQKGGKALEKKANNNKSTNTTTDNNY